MVSVAVSNLAALESINFIEPGVKVNGAYYRDNLLTQKLLPDLFWISQGGFFVFRQDGASSRQQRRFPGAKGTQLHSSNTVLEAAEFTGP